MRKWRILCGGAGNSQINTSYTGRSRPVKWQQKIMMSWLGGGDLEWNVSVLLPWVLQLLALEHVQVLAHLLSGLRWDNDVVNESSDSSWEGVAEQLGVLLLVLDGVLLIVTEKDGDGSLGSHDGNLSSWPSVVDISTKMLG